MFVDPVHADAALAGGQTLAWERPALGRQHLHLHLLAVRTQLTERDAHGLFDGRSARLDPVLDLRSDCGHPALAHLFSPGTALSGAASVYSVCCWVASALALSRSVSGPAAPPRRPHAWCRWRPPAWCRCASRSCQV